MASDTPESLFSLAREMEALRRAIGQLTSVTANRVTGTANAAVLGSAAGTGLGSQIGRTVGVGAARVIGSAFTGFRQWPQNTQAVRQFGAVGGAVGRVAGGIAGGAIGGGLGVAAAAVGTGFTLAVAAVKKFSETIGEATTIVGRFGSYSMAGLSAQIQTTIGDFKRNMEISRAMGGEMIAFSRATIKARDAWKGIDTEFNKITLNFGAAFAKLLEKLAPVVEPFVKSLGDASEWVAASVEVFADGLKAVGSTINTFVIEPFKATIKAVINALMAFIDALEQSANWVLGWFGNTKVDFKSILTELGKMVEAQKEANARERNKLIDEQMVAIRKAVAEGKLDPMEALKKFAINPFEAIFAGAGAAARKGFGGVGQKAQRGNLIAAKRLGGAVGAGKDALQAAQRKKVQDADLARDAALLRMRQGDIVALQGRIAAEQQKANPDPVHLDRLRKTLEGIVANVELLQKRLDIAVKAGMIPANAVPAPAGGRRPVQQPGQPAPPAGQQQVNPAAGAGAAFGQAVAQLQRRPVANPVVAPPLDPAKKADLEASLRILKNQFAQARRDIAIETSKPGGGDPNIIKNLEWRMDQFQNQMEDINKKLHPDQVTFIPGADRIGRMAAAMSDRLGLMEWKIPRVKLETT